MNTIGKSTKDVSVDVVSLLYTKSSQTKNTKKLQNLKIDKKITKFENSQKKLQYFKKEKKK